MHEQKNAEYKKVARILITYNKNLPIKQEADKKLFGKRAFVQLHQTELEAFEYAEREITRLGLSSWHGRRHGICRAERP